MTGIAAEDSNMVPDFLIRGFLKKTICHVQDPLIGQIVVERSELPLRSIDLQLVRVEIVTGARKLIYFVHK